MKNSLCLILSAVILVLTHPSGIAQDKDEQVQTVDDSYKPLKINIDESGKKYIRFIIWNQFWLNMSENANEETTIQPLIRRSRILSFAQISDRFMILTHFGLNNLTANNMGPLGQEASTQLFLHGAWGEFKIIDQIAIGGGLHYWNGLSRITSASTLNFMTLDNYRQGWAQLGLSDQFARHMGVYIKGRFGKLNYHFAINDPITNNLEEGRTPGIGTAVYQGKEIQSQANGNDANTVYQGYVDYQFLDQESNKLPYRVGSYLGKKTVFNVGAGFFSHPSGSVSQSPSSPTDFVYHDVNHFAIDAYYDAPVARGAINAYLVYYNFDYGPNYSFGPYGTGSSVYGQAGFLLPDVSNKIRLMPYVAYSTRNYEAFEEPGNTFQVGSNIFITGHNAKLTFEYNSTRANFTGNEPDRTDRFVIQAMVFL
ncbi:hypothetical protein [Mangrovivirga cuniculi]|uniref:Short chain amide porin n=1 Tax=Mangrovivirga cuniculi TaxID=2715131 RepID=A0A4D7JYR4_9BACT|nr:hypothetical protein [Mangrovivirga cuniculi]QCK15845.1 hypothetical protein DCC35_14370 [Mangrovivirga cuniculi]